MENKDDLISRRAALDIVAKDSGMTGTYDQIEYLPGEMTAAEAWGIMRRIVCDEELGGFSEEELKDIFNVPPLFTIYPDEIFNKFTPEEVKAKIEAWENRLKVGDVVGHVGVDGVVVITKIYSGGELCEAMTEIGRTGTYKINNLRKTGKTIDIQSVLEQLGE